MGHLREADGLVWVSCIIVSAGPVILSNTLAMQPSPIKHTTYQNKRGRILGGMFPVLLPSSQFVFIPDNWIFSFI